MSEPTITRPNCKSEDRADRAAGGSAPIDPTRRQYDQKIIQTLRVVSRHIAPDPRQRSPARAGSRHGNG
jgi:hypothetical protein